MRNMNSVYALNEIRTYIVRKGRSKAYKTTAREHEGRVDYERKRNKK